METSDTFTLLPLTLDPTTKAISSAIPASTALTEELTALNQLHRSLLSLEAPHTVPPPPLPVVPKRSAQITKLRESGNADFRKNRFPEAIRMYSVGIDMALARPGWEPSGLVREEVSALFANRAQAHMSLQQWVEGALDAESSVEMKKVGNAKAWWRRGKCLQEMGRVEEASEWVGQALEFEAAEADLLQLKKELDAQLVQKGR
ncbi:tetratricopeptide repeat domain-containing protein [Mytilinidion resinicola]|uniref:Tetratricopeptide repeat domain-containing protein n=1 Tax=Mytilinidion resinicola TaxID=574789 RepID=A0A6A6YRP0_9PEZI|nr:tetratricopeptide repeat domain-containing protein [Mytilinidion resinicola]KAF2811602.1 tetratricopeptide repeat domain-containing protein [Mytilinidion resinicola]